MPATVAEKRAAFRRLHDSGCFVIPNPWDVGSAIMLQRLGFKALASTSAGMAWAMGRPDNGVTRDDVLAHLQAIVEATDLPVNADYENAFADDPDGVATNIAAAADTGIAGVSVEDSTGNPDAPLYDFDLAVARVAAARAAIDRTGSGVLLTARSEGFIAGRPDLDETVRRLKAFAEAGADCLYAPGIGDDAQIGTVVQAVAPKPVNVLTLGRPVAELAALGARRISVGGSLARAAYGEFLRAARGIADEGSFAAFKNAAASRELNGFFADRKEGRG
ncbi:2-methylisocitrate lyase [Thalassobaculum fulvum]|uniref:2-methylisocitrate lyase n=1 Tax=Thalassobaculum fulvum TaxID=1633335 RepID=A0A919CSC7_9PROT|nr:isocitrate lyase/phosphoenolpyruvate mutase family protein [Thalassobaculum fulvum]GHD62839.1 2-methylisocitrate lyase [Thalassobaculum fulvum]